MIARSDLDLSQSNTVESLKTKLESAGVEFVFAAYVDVHGVPKAKCVPIRQFDEMCGGSELYPSAPWKAWAWPARTRTSAAPFPTWTAASSSPGTALRLAQRRHPLPRPALSRRQPGDPQESRGAGEGDGVRLPPGDRAGVLRAAQGGGPVRPPRGRPFKGPNACYDVRQTLGSMEFLAPMCRYIEELGWGMHSFDQECGRGQFEFDFHYADAVTMADRLVFLRLMAKQVAESIGALATFMPKPFANDFRSGADFNISLADVRTGKNVFFPADNPASERTRWRRVRAELLKLCLNFVAGLLKHRASRPCAALRTTRTRG